jgi:hypothetical protein
MVRRNQDGGFLGQDRDCVPGAEHDLAAALRRDGSFAKIYDKADRIVTCGGHG